MGCAFVYVDYFPAILLVVETIVLRVVCCVFCFNDNFPVMLLFNLLMYVTWSKELPRTNCAWRARSLFLFLCVMCVQNLRSNYGMQLAALSDELVERERMLQAMQADGGGGKRRG